MNREELIEEIRNILTQLGYNVESISEEILIETYIKLHSITISGEDIEKIVPIDKVKGLMTK